MAFGRKAELTLGANRRRLKRDLRAAEGDIARFGSAARARLKGVFGMSLGSLATFGSAAGLAMAGKEVLALEDKMTRLRIQAKLTDEAMRVHEGTMRSVGLEYGLGKGAVFEATSQLVDLQGAVALTTDNIAALGRVMTATGGAGEDIARVVSALADAGIKGKDAEEAISALIEAGDQGSIPYAKMAGILAGIIPLAKDITSEGKRGAAELGAMLQIMGKATGGNEGASSTLVEGLVNGLSKSRERLKKAGFGQLFDKRGFVKKIDEMLPHFQKLAKHKDLITLVGRAEAARAVRALAEHADEYRRIAKVAEQSNAVQINAQKYLQSNAGRTKKALAEIREKIYSLFTPERIAMFTAAAERAVDVTGWLFDNLGKIAAGIVAIKGLKFGMTIAQWGESFSALQANLAASGKGASALGGQVGRFAGFMGKAVGALGAFTASFTLATAALSAIDYDDWLNKKFGIANHQSGMAAQNDQTQAEKRALADHRAWMERFRSGTLTAGDTGHRAYDLERARELGKKGEENLTAADWRYLRKVSFGKVLAHNTDFRTGKVVSGEVAKAADVAAADRRLAVLRQAEAETEAAKKRGQGFEPLARKVMQAKIKEIDLGVRAERDDIDKTIDRADLERALVEGGYLEKFQTFAPDSTQRHLDRERWESKRDELITQLLEQLLSEREKYADGRLHVDVILDGQKVAEGLANQQAGARE